MPARTKKKTPAKAGNRKQTARAKAPRVSKPTRRKNPRGRHRNPSEAQRAADLYLQFHGKAADKTTVIDEQYDIPDQLADLGKLISLTVWTDEDRVQDIKPDSNVRVASTGEGGSLYFVGGNQRLDLTALGAADGLPKDHVAIGPVQQIAYLTSKDFHEFEPVIYEHEFGEESGILPILCYDTRAERMYLVGGNYRVRRPGIED